MRKIIIPIIIVVGLALIVAISVIVAREDTATVVGTVVDDLGATPVHKAAIIVGDKTTIRYADTAFELTGIPPGKYTLIIEAPAYERVEQEITLKRGLNSLPQIKMKGTEITDLKSVSLMAEPIKGEGAGFVILFVNSQDELILFYPRLPLTFEAKLYLRVGDREDYTHGKLLYEGPLELSWNPLGGPGKNMGSIPEDKIDVEPGFAIYGVLEGMLRTPQGDFEVVNADVSLNYGF